MQMPRYAPLLDLRCPTYEAVSLDPVTGLLTESLAVSEFRCSDTGALTVTQAHTVMQHHRDCWKCGAWRTARRTLIAAGDLVPATGVRRFELTPHS